MSNRHAEELHKDQRKSRMEHGANDLHSIIEYFIKAKPFREDRTELCRLSTGIVADKPVNVELAEAVGSIIVMSMAGKSVSQFKFTKKDQVVTLGSSVYVHVDGERVEMDPKHLYQRLSVAGIGNIDIQTLFQV